MVCWQCLSSLSLSLSLQLYLPFVDKRHHRYLHALRSRCVARISRVILVFPEFHRPLCLRVVLSCLHSCVTFPFSFPFSPVIVRCGLLPAQVVSLKSFLYHPHIVLPTRSRVLCLRLLHSNDSETFTLSLLSCLRKMALDLESNPELRSLGAIPLLLSLIK